MAYVDWLLIETCHRFINISILEIGTEDIWIEDLLAIVDLNRIKHLALPSAMDKESINCLINNMPCLQHLSIDTVRFLSKSDKSIIDIFLVLFIEPFRNRIEFMF